MLVVLCALATAESRAFRYLVTVFRIALEQQVLKLPLPALSKPVCIERYPCVPVRSAYVCAMLCTVSCVCYVVHDEVPNERVY